MPDAGRTLTSNERAGMSGDNHVHGPDCAWHFEQAGEPECLDGFAYQPERTPSLREKVARAIAEAADDGVFDRDEPDCTSDDEDRAYWLNLADAALIAAGLSPQDTWTCRRCQAVRYSSAGYGEHLLACSLMSEGARRG